jgi:hypothetical protein
MMAPMPRATRLPAPNVLLRPFSLSAAWAKIWSSGFFANKLMRWFLGISKIVIDAKTL